MKRALLAIIVLFTGNTSIGMDAPMEDVGTKRPRIEVLEPGNLSSEQTPVKSALQLLPEEMLFKIIDELIPAKGFGPEKMYNAARNIRSFLLSSKDFSPFASNKEFNGKLIQKFAQRYHITVIDAAIILHTKGAQEWLADYAELHYPYIAKRLIQALEDRDEDIIAWIEKAIEEKPYVLRTSVRGNDGMTLLMAAAQANNLPLVQKILSQIPNAQVNERTPDNIDNALSFATQNGNVPMMQLLLAHGAQVFWENTNPVETDIWTALHHAIWNGYPQAVQLLLTKPGVADHINDRIWDGETALDIALGNVEENREAIVWQLLQVPGISLYGSLSKIKDKRPLEQTLRLMDLLIQAGANVNENNLLIRIIKEHNVFGQREENEAAEKIIAFLLSKGADINHATDEKMKTPLMVAAKGGNKRLVNFLIAHGADVSLKDASGKTALDYANQSSQPDKDKIIQILKDTQIFHEARKKQELQ